MHDDIKKFKQLVENAHMISEAYEDKVNKVADAIIQNLQHVGTDKDELLRGIDRFSKEFDISDYRISPQAKKDFIKDVLAALKGKISIKRGARGPQAKTIAKQAIAHVANILSNDMVNEMGNVFPDGDPYDAKQAVIARFVRAADRDDARVNKLYFGNPDMSLWMISDALGREAWQDMTDWVEDHVWPVVEAAFRKDHGSDTHGYLADLWDQVVGDHKYDARTQAEAAKSRMLAQGKSESEAQAAYDAQMEDFENSPWGGENPYR